MSGNAADPDMTAMAIQALANYKDDNEAVAQAIEKAVECLSNLQDENDGGFLGSDGKSSESCAQVIVALTKLGIDPSADARFVKNGHSVFDSIKAAIIATMIAAYVKNPYERKIFENQSGLSEKTERLKYALVFVRAIEGTSEPESLISEPPKKFPTPIPNVVIARPVTF